MNGKVTIDGYYRGYYEIHTHGAQADPEAICSLTMRIDRNVEALELLEIMKNSVQRSINAENDEMIRKMLNKPECEGIEAIHNKSLKESINRNLEEAGLAPLPDNVLDCILDEIEFQRASECTG
ncbi:MAG TPA: hypothetical protein VEG39_08450 [Clostridia bacterium]|nr:hypothetical protein [Clostridia bacterium]